MSEEQMAPAASAERRQHPRTNIIGSQLVTVDLAESGASLRRGIVIDLSEGGLAMQPFLPLLPGSTSPLHIELPRASQPFTGTGMVAWVGAGGRAGIRFLEVPEPARETLRRWLSEEARVRSALVNPAGAAGEPARLSQEEIDLNAALELIADRARSMISATGVAIALGDASGMVCRVSMGNAPDVGVQLRPDAGLSGCCLRNAELVHCANTGADERVNPEAARCLGVGSMVVLPVFAAGRFAGVLEVLAPQANAFAPRHLARLQRLAELLGGAIQEYAPSPVEAAPELTPVAAAAN